MSGTEAFPESRSPHDIAVEEYVNQHLGGYIEDLTASLAAATSDTDFVGVVRLVAEGKSFEETQIETEARNKILEQLDEQFSPRYPDRAMSRIYTIEHEGKLAKDLDPPARAFEVIQFFIPKRTDTGPSTNGDIRVGLVW